MDDPFAEAEADGEVFEVLRRAHHDGVGAAVIGQRQRGLFRNHARAFAGAAVAPDLAMNGANRIVHWLLRRFDAAAMRLRMTGLLVIGLLPFGRTVATAKSAPR